MTAAAVIILAAYTLMIVGNTNKVPGRRGSPARGHVAR